MEKKLINYSDFRKVSPIFNGDRGLKLAKLVMNIFAIEKVNAMYERCGDHKGADFADCMLKDVGVNYCIGNAERLKPLQDGAFVTVSNHPYGGIDGVMLIDLMAGIRSDYKFMVNQLLSQVEAMEENFISVMPKVGRKSPKTTTNINSVRETLTHIREGHPVGFFPAGAVSMFHFKDFRVRDREWQKSILRLIHSVKVPIVPIRFFDKNSFFFYLLGLIDWRIRQFRMPYELFNKKNRKTRLGIGNIISVEEQSNFPDARSLGKYLYKVIYKMPVPASFINRSDIDFRKKTLMDIE